MTRSSARPSTWIPVLAATQKRRRGGPEWGSHRGGLWTAHAIQSAGGAQAAHARHAVTARCMASASGVASSLASRRSLNDDKVFS
jgi:hypothetical protein